MPPGVGEAFRPLFANGRIFSEVATDGQRVFIYNKEIAGADGKTFVLTSPTSGKDSRHTYNWHDGNLKVDEPASR